MVPSRCLVCAKVFSPVTAIQANDIDLGPKTLEQRCSSLRVVERILHALCYQNRPLVRHVECLNREPLYTEHVLSKRSSVT